MVDARMTVTTGAGPNQEPGNSGSVANHRFRYYTVGYDFPKHTERTGKYDSLEGAILGANRTLGEWTVARIIHIGHDKSVAEIWRDTSLQNHHVRLHYDALEEILQSEIELVAELLTKDGSDVDITLEK